jgi:hypothetical protein
VKTPTPIKGNAVTLGQISSGPSTVSSRARRSRMLVSTLCVWCERVWIKLVGEKNDCLVGCISVSTNYRKRSWA